MEGRQKEEEKETSFEELMGKKNKMTKNMMTNMKDEDQGEDHPEPEADPSAGGSVKQIHEQITMCVKEEESGTSRNEGPVAEMESHRVDEINLFEKFSVNRRRRSSSQMACGQWSHMPHHCRAVAV